MGHAVNSKIFVQLLFCDFSIFKLFTRSFCNKVFVKSCRDSLLVKTLHLGGIKFARICETSVLVNISELTVLPF